jgi:hypothetical protein
MQKQQAELNTKIAKLQAEVGTADSTKALKLVLLMLRQVPLPIMYKYKVKLMRRITLRHIRNRQAQLPPFM